MKKMKWLSVLFFLIVTTIVLAESLPYVDAGSIEGEIQSVEVSGNTSTPIILKKGTTSIITIKFKCLANVEKANIYARFIIGGEPMPYTKGELKAVSYPLNKDQDYVGKFELKVLDTYPKVTGVLNIAFKNEGTKNDIFNFNISARIK